MDKPEIDYISNQIIEMVNVLQLLKHFNVEIKGSYCRCFIHGGEHFKMKIFKDGCVCMSECRTSLNAITIVQHFHNCNWRTACEYLNDMYNLGLFKPLTKEEKEERDKQIKMAEMERQKQEERKKYSRWAYSRLCDYFQWLKHNIDGFAPQTVEDIFNGEFIEACHMYDYIEFVIDKYMHNIDDLADDIPDIEQWVKDIRRSFKI